MACFTIFIGSASKFLVCVVFCTTALESVREMMRKRESVDARLPEKRKTRFDVVCYDHGCPYICVDNTHTHATSLTYIRTVNSKLLDTPRISHAFSHMRSIIRIQKLNFRISNNVEVAQIV